MLKASWLFKGINALVRPWRGVRIAHCYFAGFAISNIEFQWAIFVKRKENKAVPFYLSQLNGFLSENLLYPFCSSLFCCLAGVVRSSMKWTFIVGRQIYLILRSFDLTKVYVPHVLELRQLLYELLLVGIVIVGDGDLISPVFDEPCFILFRELCMIYDLVKFVEVRLMVNQIDALAERWVRDVRRRLATFNLHGGWGKR